MGQHGLGADRCRPRHHLPTHAGDAEDPNVKAVFAVGNNTFAVKNDGTFWGWSSGATGQWPLNADARLPSAIALP